VKATETTEIKQNHVRVKATETTEIKQNHVRVKATETTEIKQNHVRVKATETTEIKQNPMQLFCWSFRRFYVHIYIYIFFFKFKKVGFCSVVRDCKERFVCKLRESLHGLKVPRQLYKMLDSFMMNLNFLRSEYNHCVYFESLENGTFVFLVLYADDMLIASQSMCKISRLEA
jgi:hypothetical protein